MLVKRKEAASSPIQFDQLTQEDKLSWLMDEYGDMVVRLAYTYVKQKQIAEDISQEVFISCYTNLDTFKNKSSYKTWLYRITVNKCKDYFRSWSYRNMSYQDFFRSIFPSGEKSVESNILDKEERELTFEKVGLFYFCSNCTVFVLDRFNPCFSSGGKGNSKDTLL
jgi:DNA-directed RNA polymerase specialized sigma24 family protein